MADVSNKTIVALLAIALVVTVVGTVVSVGKLNSLGGRYASLTGAVTSDGTTAIEVQGTANITVTASSISIGAGYYTPSCSTGFSKIRTNNTESSAPNTTSCWTFAADGVDNQSRNTQFHTIENTGSTNLNVTANITATTSAGGLTTGARSILCGAGGCPVAQANALIAIRAHTTEASSCAGTLQTTGSTLADNSAVTATGQNLCTRFLPENGNDEFNTSFELDIPKDADQGARAFTVTYTGVTVN